MTTGFEPVLHALSVEPRTARPGEIVSIAFRARNDAALPSPEGTVVFELPDGLEPLDGVQAALRPAGAGEVACAVVRARVRPPRDQHTELALRARLMLPDMAAITNTCMFRVRSRAILDDDESGTFVELLDDDTVRVRAVVRNGGDGPALGVRLELPVPSGCRRLDGEDTLGLERLDPGAVVTLEYLARIEQRVEHVVAEGAGVHFGAAWQMLAVRSAVVLEPRIAQPAVAVRCSRRRVELDLALRNDGWAHAHDVPLRIALPAGVELAAATVAVDGIPLMPRRRRGAAPSVARLAQQGDAHLLTIALLPARSTVRVTFAATHDGNAAPGLLELRLTDHRVEVELRPERHDELRVETLSVPLSVPPGALATIRARVVNAGDRAEHWNVALERSGLTEAAPVSRALEPGTFAIVELPLTVPASATDGERIPFALVLAGAQGERSRHELDVMVRMPSGGTAPYDEDIAVEEADDRVAPVVHAVLRTPDGVVCGAPFAASLDIDVEDTVESLIVRTIDDESTQYVPGSTTAGDCIVLDSAGRSRLSGGLVLRGIPAATRVRIGWRSLAAAPPGTSLAIGVELEVDGIQRTVTPVEVEVHDAPAFAIRPAELPYHVDAPTLAPHDRATAEPGEDLTDDDAGTDDLSNDTFASHDREPVDRDPIPVAARRWNDVARLMYGARCTGLVLHLLALRALFPEPDPDAGDAVTRARDAVGEALRDLFDRLFIKLRIPNFIAGTDDLEDGVLRRALLAYGDANGDEARNAVLLDAPLGGPTALRALISAVVNAHDSPFDRAVAQYFHQLDAVLCAFEDVPLGVFEAALESDSDRRLDAARANVLALLDEQLVHEPLAC
jgi:hypothetical protein